MVEFKEGMAVIVIGEFNEIKKGTIKDIYASLGYVIVDFGNGVLEKVEFDKLGILPETEPIEAEQPEEPDKNPKKDRIEKTEITITPEKFRKITSRVVGKESAQGGPILMIVGSILLAEIHKALFIDAWEND
jgi:hypothetical protein